MTIAERLSTMDDKALANLKANATRLQSGETRRREEAAQLLPLIEAEMADRISRLPPKPPRAPVKRRRVAEPVAEPAEAPTED